MKSLRVSTPLLNWPALLTEKPARSVPPPTNTAPWGGVGSEGVVGGNTGVIWIRLRSTSPFRRPLVKVVPP